MATPAALCDHVPVPSEPSTPTRLSAVDALDLLQAQLGLDQGHGVAIDAVAGVTRWCVRLILPGIPPADAVIVAAAAAAGLSVDTLLPARPGRPRWLLLGPQARPAVSAAVARLRQAHRIHAVPFRRLTEHRQEHP